MNKLVAGAFDFRLVALAAELDGAPTTVPAMIIAGFCWTKPSNATARPVNAL